jgi:voltage-dependent calcium channel
MNLSPHALGIDLSRLHMALSTLDAETTRQRRLLYNRLYHEARLTFERGKGISFTNMLLMLAHNKLITDKEALRWVLTMC